LKRILRLDCDCVARETLWTSLFRLPSLRTSDGSPRWSRDRHPPRFCASRSVEVAQKRQDQCVKARLSTKEARNQAVSLVYA
jgi:hypothetical protein